MAFFIVTAVQNLTSYIFLTRAIRRHILEDGILHSHRRVNLKPYINLMFHILKLLNISTNSA
jgi:hypothetical protein